MAITTKCIKGISVEYKRSITALCFILKKKALTLSITLFLA